MKSVSQSASKTVISYIYKLIQTNKFSHLIALIYDNILENSNKPFLNKAQAEIILSLLCLPNQKIPNIVSYADLCLLLKDAYEEKFGNVSNKNEENLSKSEDSWDEENLEEMEVLSTLNSFRTKTHAQCSDIFNFIRQENLIRTVMRQAWKMQKLKKDLYEMEQKMDYLVAHYVAGKYCACQNGEYSECDSGCHTDRSSSSNNSITKSFVTKKDETNDMTIISGQNFLTVNDSHKNNGMNSYQKTMKSLNENGKSLYDEQNICIDNKPSTSFTSIRNIKSNDFSLSINQTIINQLNHDMIVKDEIMSKTELDSKKSMNILSAVNYNFSNVKHTINNLLSNDTNTISQHNNLSMRMTQSVIGTNVLPNYRNKFTKLQLTTNFKCYDYDEQISCKKIELKKYIEFDTSSFWNKK
ncbi:unnamed protein product [Brugia pahangi]|uniref:MIF4G domain-containing protein n=1 Tax=Brugia pahangi TaxID=6280 RepID=A0A0N4TN13_BRUPA|nr:unnamed protein product [Brugia pahangi]